MVGWIVDPGDTVVTRWIFLRLLGGIYLIAFASFAVQASGLVGRRGILPAGAFLAAVKKALGRSSYLAYPTLLWLNASDPALKTLSLAGIGLALLLLFGLQITPILFLLWFLYLSLVIAGQVFFSYQWDVLLLEAGFLSIFLVPPSLLPAQALGPPAVWIIYLFRWLLFRLVFMSGILKLANRDPAWRNLTALAYHYETQPLPTPLAWFAHKLPAWFHQLSTLLTLVIEIAVPLFFFTPGLPGTIAAGITIFLQILILLTGNFAFFNLLTIVLAIFLFPGRLLLPVLPAPFHSLAAQTGSGGPGYGLIPGMLLIVFYVTIGGIYLLRPWIRNKKFYQFLQPLLHFIASFRLANSYGLFTVMTTEHPEISLEGSVDGQEWIPYEFKYKPGALERALPIVAPHQPRLDWQMWFAALGNLEDNPWFMNLVVRLLEGAPEVTGLLARNPFPERPPLYLRAVRYDYDFTTTAERKLTGRWWKREELGFYMPPVSMRMTKP